MDLTQHSTIPARPAGPRSRRLGAIALVVILAVVAISEAFIIGALVRDMSAHGSIDQRPGAATAAVADALHAPSMATFWAEERELGGKR